MFFILMAPIKQTFFSSTWESTLQALINIPLTEKNIWTVLWDLTQQEKDIARTYLWVWAAVVQSKKQVVQSLQSTDTNQTVWEKQILLLKSIPKKIREKQNVMIEKWFISTQMDKKLLLLLKDKSKIQYVKDQYNDTAIQFPTLWLQQRYEYLRMWSMVAGQDYNDYDQSSAFRWMPHDKLPLVYKKTIDVKWQRFTDALDTDCYGRWYSRKMKSQQDSILQFLADELWLSYDPDTTDDQEVVKAYMYITWSIWWEFFNTDRKNKKDWDKYWQVWNKSISPRAAMRCNDICQSLVRLADDLNHCAIPLLKEIW